MGKIFVHLSDIHFGQERGGRLVIHNDVKRRLLEDAAEVVARLPSKQASGVIVSGDITYAGKKEEYRQAAAWLDLVAAAVGCEITDIQVVPGNHDIDREEITLAAELMLKKIVDEGEETLDAFLAAPRDREMLYARFTNYRPFAEGYDCPLDHGGGLAADRTVSLGSGRSLRFIGLNTALICSRDDQKGKLLLGARQRVLPKTDGQELIVVAHHPLHWLQDSEDARRYVRSRARVLISGHEHTPGVQKETVAADCDLLMLAAGAAVPPRANDKYTYTYNVLEFDREEQSDLLRVTVHPRTWSEDNKCFEADTIRLGGADPVFTLGCPNFRRAPRLFRADQDGAKTERAVEVPSDTKVATVDEAARGEESVSASRYPIVLLRFFRDLSPGQRLSILVKLGALPNDWPEPLTHAVERRVFDSLHDNGRLDEIEQALNELTTSTGEG